LLAFFKGDKKLIWGIKVDILRNYSYFLLLFQEKKEGYDV